MQRRRCTACARERCASGTSIRSPHPRRSPRSTTRRPRSITRCASHEGASRGICCCARQQRRGEEGMRAKSHRRRGAINGSGASAPAARVEGLRYTTDREPGIRRCKRGRGFLYLQSDGRTVTDAAVLARIRALAIPPAYRDVWICARANGHLQATGRDARGRKQYRYHARWRLHRDATKFDRMLEFGHVLPRIRRRVASDLHQQGLPREKVLAAIVRLLECTLVRVGNEEYARDNGSFGLTTLRDRHVRVKGPTVQLEFRGKSGIQQKVSIEDRVVARIVRDCRDIPGQELFQWIDAE